MYQALKRLYISARELRYFLFRDEFGSVIRTPWHVRLRMVPKGYLSQSAVLYDLTRNSLYDYISDLARIRMGRITALRNLRAGYTVFLDNKIAFAAIFGRVLQAPMVFAFIEKGRIVALDREWSDATSGSLAEFCDRAGGTLVFKPVAGAKGKDVFFVRHENGRLMMDGEQADEAHIRARIGRLDEFIVSEFIVQDEFGAGLYSTTTNTMRIVTMIDPASGEPFIPIAVHRVGTKRSEPVDNWSRGGLSAEIDLETGELGPGASCPVGRERLVWHKRHPDTDAPIAGQVVPDWPRHCEDLLGAARRLPFLAIIGWDLVISSGTLVAIEANATTDVDLLQIHRPLLRDQRVRDFFRRHSIV